MTSRPDQIAPTRIITDFPAKRRRWPWVLAITVVCLLVAVVLMASRITCRLVQRQTPIPCDGVVIRGAQFGGKPATAAMVVGQCSPAVFKRVVEGASGRWLPGMLLSDGQHAWGTFTDAPEVTWRLDIDATADEPRITARIPQSLAERLIAGQLRREHSPVSQVKLQEVSLTGEPQGNETSWQARLRGTAQVVVWDQPTPIEVEQIVVALTTVLTPRPDGDRGMTARMEISEMRGTSPFGPLTMFTQLIQKQVNQDLGREMPKVLVPGWWPAATHWDLRVVPSGVEF